jgi:tRNA A-37 threonylcarbamoyl transferase component Bud32
MDWLSLVEKKCGIKILKWEKFFSRRNEVFAVEGLGEKARRVKYAVKNYCQEGTFIEPWIMEELAAAGVKVPKLIWYNDHIMVTEFISGAVLADLMEKDDVRKTKTPLWTEQLARWLFRLHSVKKFEGLYFSMPDLNLRNFIFDGKDLFGLDFEELVFHQPERDLGGVAAFILSSNPMFEPWEFDAVGHLIKSYDELRKINIWTVEKYFFAEMEATAIRRKGQRDYLRGKITELKAQKLFEDVKYAR